MKIKWEWKPLVSIGPIKFGEAIVDIEKHLKIIDISDPDPNIDWETYVVPDDGAHITVESEIVDFVECNTNFFYKNQNFIGKTFDEIKDLLDGDYRIKEDDYVCQIDYDALGLTLWVEDGIINSAQVSSEVLPE